MEKNGEKLVEESDKIIKALDVKGWVLYYRGPAGGKISIEETFKRGPVTSLQKGIIYVLRPKVDDPTNREAIEDFVQKNNITSFTAKLKIPKTCHDYCGRAIHEFEQVGDSERITEERELNPGDELPWLGIKFLSNEIWVLSQHETFMPYDIFLESISGLIDLSKI